MSSLLQLDEETPLSRRGTVLVCGAAVAYAAVLVWALPRSADPLAPVAAVPLAHAVSLAVITSLTALVLWLEASRSRRRGYLVLGGTFSSITVLMIGFVLAFPSGLRTGPDGAPLPLLGGASTSVAFFVAWHVVLAAGVPAAAVVLTRDVSVGRRPVLKRLWVGVLLGILPAAALTAWWLLAPDAVPTLLAAGTPTPTGRLWLQVGTWLTIAGLIVTVGVTRGRSIISRWLIALCLLNAGDALLNTQAERYSIGWYTARGVGFFTLSILLIVLLWELSRVDERMQQLALRDTLTGARARVTFVADAEREIARARRDGSRVALLWLDLDVFKQVNDRWGHGAGDRLLVEVRRRLQDQVRDSDLVVRMGGDEFALLLVGIASVDDATAAAARVVAALRSPARVADGQVSPRASVGVALFPDTAADVDELVHQADVAMYTAKAGGGDRFALYDAAQDLGYTSRAMLRRRLDGALADDELDLDAQPIVATADGAVRGVELLLRWDHDGERSSGASFAVEAERVGRSRDIAWVVLDRLEAALPSLLADPRLELVSINLCVPDLLDDAVVERLASPPFADAARHIVLELIESAAIDDDAVAALGSLARLRTLGYRLALDDFGVGFSNIVRLQQLRPDLIKIDRSLLLRASTGAAGAVDVLAWATSIGRTLGAVTLVEGVETQAEAELVRQVGADLAQGYWYGRPGPLAPDVRAGTRARTLEPLA